MEESKLNTNFIECVNALDIRHFKRIADCLEDCTARELYIDSYTCLRRFTQDVIKRPTSDAKSTITALAHMVYGWMPTMLDSIDYDGTNFNDLFDEFKSNRNVDIDKVRTLTNGSVVGASKLLHFVHPDKYPIFDSRVYRGIIRIYNIIYDKKIPIDHDIAVPNLSKNTDFYKEYQTKLNKIADTENLGELKEKLKKKGYINKDASDVRTLEVCLYIIGAGLPKENNSQKENINKLMERLSSNK